MTHVPLSLGEAYQLLGSTRIAAKRETARGYAAEDSQEAYKRRVMVRADAKRRALGLVVVDGVWCREVR